VEKSGEVIVIVFEFSGGIQFENLSKVSLFNFARSFVFNVIRITCLFLSSFNNKDWFDGEIKFKIIISTLEYLSEFIGAVADLDVLGESGGAGMGRQDDQ